MQMKSTKRHISMVSLVFLVLFSVLNVWAPVIQAAVMKSPVTKLIFPVLMARHLNRIKPQMV